MSTEISMKAIKAKLVPQLHELQCHCGARGGHVRIPDWGWTCPRCERVNREIDRDMDRR